MKKTRIIVLIAVVFVLCNGCGSKLNNDIPNDFTPVYDPNVEYALSHTDWVHYDTAQKIVDKSDVIFVGKLETITFEVVDFRTGKTVQEVTQENYMDTGLYTIYSVVPEKRYVGDVGDRVYISLIDGLPGYDEKKQLELLEKTGLSKYLGGKIPVSDGQRCNLAVGKSYLFCVIRTWGDYDCVINPTQFAFDLDSENAKEILKCLHQ